MNTSKYRNDVVWRTKIENVQYLTEETENTPATYRLTVKPEDLNDNGAMDINIDTKHCLVDHYGTPYSIIAVNGLILNVSDDFRTQECPQSGLTGFIYKTAYKGMSHFLPPVMYRFLHPNAAANRDQYNLAILWGNDPNGRRIPFTNVLMPTIADYRGELTDEDGITFKPMEDYGQNPQFEIWQINEDDTYSQLSIYPNITRSLVDNLIDSVLFSGTGEEITGYILIKN